MSVFSTIATATAFCIAASSLAFAADPEVTDPAWPSYTATAPLADEVVCLKVPVTGTRVGGKACATRAEWRRRTMQERRNLDAVWQNDMRTHGGTLQP